MTKDEALRLALEALIEVRDTNIHGLTLTQDYHDAITAIKAALEAKDEPVIYDKTELNSFVQGLYDKKMQEGKHGHFETMFHCVHQAIKRVSPPQRTWAGLTDDEVWEWFRDNTALTNESGKRIYKVIEAKLKEKNI